MTLCLLVTQIEAMVDHDIKYGIFDYHFDLASLIVLRDVVFDQWAERLTGFLRQDVALFSPPLVISEEGSFRFVAHGVHTSRCAP